MKKSRKRPPKPRRKGSALLPPPKQSGRWWTPLRKLLAGSFAGLTAVVGLVTGAISFLPRMTVDASLPFDELNAYSTSFTVANTGFIPLRDVSLSIGLCDIKTAKRDFGVSPGTCKPPRWIPPLLLGNPAWEIPELPKDNKFTLPLEEILNVDTPRYRAEHPRVIGSFRTLSRLESADLIVTVNYRPWFMPWHSMDGFRFVAERQSNEKIIWRAVPIDWNPPKWAK
jgi:hypothetical protein